MWPRPARYSAGHLRKRMGGLGGWRARDCRAAGISGLDGEQAEHGEATAKPIALGRTVKRVSAILAKNGPDQIQHVIHHATNTEISRCANLGPAKSSACRDQTSRKS
jgi:hypothetical protein